MEIPGTGRHVSSGRMEDPAAPVCSQNVHASSSFVGREFHGGLLALIVTAYVLCIGLGLWCTKKTEERAETERSTHPSKIDWVKAGAVSRIVRNQNGCGCCWAMAVAASVEAVHYLKTRQSISLSVQELIDFDTSNNGCKGGCPERALRYIQTNGLSSESSYPYMAQKNISCRKMDKPVAARILGFQYVDCNEDALEKAVAQQPVVVYLQMPSDLNKYKGGIIEYEALPYTLPDGSITKWHAVLFVGYDTDRNGIKYWRFKNSWGRAGASVGLEGSVGTLMTSKVSWVCLCVEHYIRCLIADTSWFQ